jgi:hypothetical protein
MNTTKIQDIRLIYGVCGALIKKREKEKRGRKREKKGKIIGKRNGKEKEEKSKNRKYFA